MLKPDMADLEEPSASDYEVMREDGSAHCETQAPAWL